MILCLRLLWLYQQYPRNNACMRRLGSTCVEIEAWQMLLSLSLCVVLVAYAQLLLVSSSVSKLKQTLVMSPAGLGSGKDIASEAQQKL
jgi:hypothetical protein